MAFRRIQHVFCRNNARDKYIDSNFCKNRAHPSFYNIVFVLAENFTKKYRMPLIMHNVHLLLNKTEKVQSKTARQVCDRENTI